MLLKCQNHNAFFKFINIFSFSILALQGVEYFFSALRCDITHISGFVPVIVMLSGSFWMDLDNI